MSTKDQLLYSALHATAMRYAAERRNLDESIEELRQIAGGHARGVHPARRAAALEVQAAEAGRRKLDEELAARGPQRDQLVAAGQEAARTRGPAWVTAVHELKDHDIESEMIKGLIPSYDDQIRQAWDKLSAAVFASQAEQAAYSAREGAKVAQQAVQALSAGLALLHELQEFERQQVGERIIAAAPATTSAEMEANFARGQRISSIAALMDGVDKGTQGHQHSVLGLAYEYRALFTPEPAPEVKAEIVEPYAVRARKAALGLGARPRTSTHLGCACWAGDDSLTAGPSTPIPGSDRVVWENLIMAKKWGTRVTTAQPKAQRPVKSSQWGTTTKAILPKGSKKR